MHKIAMARQAACSLHADPNVGSAVKPPFPLGLSPAFPLPKCVLSVPEAQPPALSPPLATAT